MVKWILALLFNDLIYLESKKLYVFLVWVTLIKSLKFPESVLPYLLNRNAEVLPIITHLKNEVLRWLALYKPVIGHHFKLIINMCP